MKVINLSNKHLQIDKANSRVVMIVGIAAFVATFSLISSRALLASRSYQASVISKKEQALKQLKDNVKAVNDLESSYQAFINQQQNIIGGNSAGSGENDGDNARIVLDALPSKYDFPALTSSLEKILKNPSYRIDTISGVDDELAQSANVEAAGPVEIPFEIGVSGSYESIQNLLVTLERSIRPIQVNRITLTADDSGVKLGVTANTFYQPQKSLKITTEEVK